MERDGVESNMKPRFLADGLVIRGLVVGRERDGLTILDVYEGRSIRRNSVLEGLRVR